MKMPNGYGSVYKLSGKRRNPYAVRKTVGYKDNGQPIYEFIGYCKTKSEGLQMLADYNKNPYDTNMSNITFDECYTKWSEDAYKKLANQTLKNYISAYNTVLPPLYRVKVTDIKLMMLQEIFDKSSKNKGTLNVAKTLIKSVLEYAVVHEIITADKVNMITYLDTSKNDNTNKVNRKVFTPNEIQDLWDKSNDDDVYKITLMLIYSGVRISELLELKKENINLSERYFYIEKSKTKAGIRYVPIAEKVVPFWEYFLNNNDFIGLSYRIFVNKFSKLISNHTIHDTRHTCISMLTNNGIDERIIKQIVGHTGGNVTQNVYTHIDIKPKLDAINTL